MSTGIMKFLDQMQPLYNEKLKYLTECAIITIWLSPERADSQLSNDPIQ